MKDNILLIITFLFCTCVCSANEGLLAYIKNDDFLIEGELGFIEYNEGKYIIAVGISEIKKKSKRGRLNARKKARLKAENKINEFINGTNVLSIKKISEKYKINFKTKEETKIQEHYKMIKEQSSGILKNLENIGKWHEDGEYFYAVGFKYE